MSIEIRTGFHAQLNEIRTMIIRLAAHVAEVIPRATAALIDNDLELAGEVIAGDDVLDELATEIEERCYRTIALQNPVASDMRAIVTAAKLTGEYERNGDLAVNICKGVRRSFGLTLGPELRALINQMSEESVRLTRLSVDAYAEANAGLAAALDDIDDRLDDLQEDFITAIFAAHGADELTLQQTVQLALIARYYERIGDHAVNIGEMVHYMVTGEVAASGSSGPDPGRSAADDDAETA